MTGVIITPVIVPVDTTPEKCPTCGKTENRITVCANCGHVYQEAQYTMLENIVGVAVVCSIPVIAIWFLLTMMQWFLPFGGEPVTLVDVLYNQWLFVTNPFGRIF